MLHVAILFKKMLLDAVRMGFDLHLGLRRNYVVSLSYAAFCNEIAKPGAVGGGLRV